MSPDDDLVPALEWAVRSLVALKPRLGAVIRAGPLGCCYALTSELVRTPSPHPSSRKMSAPTPPNRSPSPLPSVRKVSAPNTTALSLQPVYWAPAFWHPDMPSYATKVVDPTGAGNAFMGGLMAALDEGKDMHEGESGHGLV